MSHTDPSATGSSPSPPTPSRRSALLVLGLALGGFLVSVLSLWLVFPSNLWMLPEPAPLPALDRPPNSSAPSPEGTRPPVPVDGAPVGVRAALPEEQEQSAIGILLLGVDRRPDEAAETARTDSMVLVVIDPRTRSAAMVSLPRDLWVPIPDHGEERINVAHAIGGPALAKQTVAQAFGVPVDHFARVDFHGFEQIVDTLGGVQVEVERPITDDAYPTEDYGTTRIHIPAGLQHMDGETALQYARSRHSENDFGRMQRQQRLLLALRERALQPDVLPKLPTLIPLAQRTIATDLSPAQMLDLARLASEIEPDRIATLVLDTRYVQPYRSPQGADLLLPKMDAIRAALRELLAPATAGPTPRPSPAVAPTSVENAAARLGPAETIRLHYQLIDERRFDEGYMLMSARLRSQRSPARYRSWFANRVSLSTVSVTLVSEDGGQAVVEGVVDTVDRADDGFVEQRVAERFVLVREDGSWRIDQVTRP